MNHKSCDFCNDSGLCIGCSGSGFSDCAQDVCPICNGSGEVFGLPCGECDGSGSVVLEEVCGDCSGCGVCSECGENEDM